MSNPRRVRNPCNSPWLASVYFARAEKGSVRYKIGISLNVASRMRGYRRQKHGAMRVLAQVPASPFLEDMLVRHLAKGNDGYVRRGGRGVKGAVEWVRGGRRFQRALSAALTGEPLAVVMALGGGCVRSEFFDPMWAVRPRAR